jgi:predicted transcriptional regulator
MDAKKLKRIKISVSVNQETATKLRQLSDETRIPQSKLLDEAVDDLAAKYQGAK